MADTRPTGLVPVPPNRRPHFCNDMLREVHVGDGAYLSIVNPHYDGGIEWCLRYGDPEDVRFSAASLISSYTYLLSDEITTQEAIRRLRIMRRAVGNIEP